MADSNQDKQDQSIEDSTAMTIEFLRARLLSERSVSKSARQKADELEKRVSELEEQLRIVSLQRKMAEKATVDVLSILESRGISDNSEAFDSGSDHETNHESNEGNDYQNGEECSVVSKRKSQLDEHSGSDFDTSPVNGRSLSWKGCNDSPRSREKFRDPSLRRRMSSIGSSSPRHYLGKSCRQIRRREARVVVEERKTEVVKNDSQENGVGTPQQGVPEFSDSTPVTLRGGVSESAVNERSITNHLEVNGHVQEKDMEKALEDQAQLIGKYKEMEKAQREWEEKFRENNISTPDSYDPGNHSDVTEERDDGKAQTQSNMGTDISEAEEAKPEVDGELDLSKESPKPQANGFLPPSHVNIEDLKDQASRSVGTVAPRFQAPEFAFPTAQEVQEKLENHNIRPPENFHHNPLSQASLANQRLEGPSSETGSSSHQGDPSGSQNNLYALVPHNPNPALSNVLGALKLAKLQLQSKMNKSPSDISSSSVHKAVQSPHPAAQIGERAEIPVGTAGLFRLPTDFAIEEAQTRADFISYRSSLPTALYYPDNRVSIATPDRFSTSPYIERRSGFPPDDHFLSRSSMGPVLRASSSLNSRPDPYFDTGPSSVNRYNNYSPHHPFAPSPDRMPRAISNEGFPGTFPSPHHPYAPSPDRMPRATSNEGFPGTFPSPHHPYTPSPDQMPRTSNEQFPGTFPRPHNPYTPSPDRMPRTTSNEQFPGTFSSSREFGPPTDRLSFYSDHVRPNNMYR